MEQEQKDTIDNQYDDQVEEQFEEEYEEQFDEPEESETSAHAVFLKIYAYGQFFVAVASIPIVIFSSMWDPREGSTVSNAVYEGYSNWHLVLAMFVWPWQFIINIFAMGLMVGNPRRRELMQLLKAGTIMIVLSYIISYLPILRI